MFLGILQNTRRGIGKRTKLLWLLVATKGKLGVEVTALDSSSLLGNEDWGQIFSAFPDCRRGGTVGEAFD